MNIREHRIFTNLKKLPAVIARLSLGRFLDFQKNQSALRVEGQKHRLFPQSHFVDGIEPRAPKGASAKMCLCVYFHDLACA